jgi:hypothetical protein
MNRQDAKKKSIWNPVSHGAPRDGTQGKSQEHKTEYYTNSPLRSKENRGFWPWSGHLLAMSSSRSGVIGDA